MILFMTLFLTGAVLAQPQPPQANEPNAAPAMGTPDAAGMDLANLRDPFRRPVLVDAQARPLSELEYYPTEQYRMVGVVTGPEHLRAMIVAPNGKTHFVAEKTKIGVRKGVITRITAHSLVIRERVLNTLGKEEIVNTELRLPDQSRDQKAEPKAGT